MSEQLTNNERMRLEEIFYHGAEKVYEAPEHWIRGDSDYIDSSESYCYDCAKKEIARLEKEHPDDEFILDGGWDIDGDYTPFCKTCGQLLSNNFTQAACNEELFHYLRYGFNPMSAMDCLSLYKVLMAITWDTFDRLIGVQEYERESDVSNHNDLYRLCRLILNNYFWIMPDNSFRHMWN